MNVYNRILASLRRIRPEDASKSFPAKQRPWVALGLSILATLAGAYVATHICECQHKEVQGRYVMCIPPRPFIPATNVAKLDLIYTLDEQRVMNVVYILGGSAFTSEDLLSLCTEAITSWEANVAPQVSDNVQLVKVQARSMVAPSAFGVELEPVTPVFGDVSGGSLPNNVTLTTKFSTGLTGRSFRGRIYTPGIPRSSVAVGAINEVSDVIAGDFSAGWATFFGDIISAASNALAHVVLSFCQNKEWLSIAEATPVISYSTNVTLDSQRRRLPERGE